MAITWKLKITVLSVVEKKISVTAVRTDDVDNSQKTFSIHRAVIKTQKQKADVLDKIWAQYEESAAKQAEIDSVVENLEAQGAANLEAREV